jgi:hypothetical protein
MITPAESPDRSYLTPTETLVASTTQGIAAIRRTTFQERSVIRGIKIGNFAELAVYLKAPRKSVHCDVLQALVDQPVRLVPQRVGRNAAAKMRPGLQILVEAMKGQLAICIRHQSAPSSVLDHLGHLCRGSSRLPDGTPNKLILVGAVTTGGQRGRKGLPYEEKVEVATKIAVWMGLRGHFNVALRGGLRQQKQLLHLLGLRSSNLRSIWRDYHAQGIDEAVQIAGELLTDRFTGDATRHHASRFLDWGGTRNRRGPE